MTLLAGARLPLAFIGFGLVALIMAVVTTAAAPGLLLLPSAHPQVIALVHLWLPGFLLSVCLGAVYQLMPVVLGTALRLREPTVWVHLGLHAVGVSLLCAGFWNGRYGWVALGGAILTIGLAIASVGILGTFRHSPRRDPAAWCFPLAAGWLASTVVLGVLLALHRRWPYLPLSAVDLLRAHAHLGLVGFFLSLLQGVTFQLVPMFTMGTLARPGLIRLGLIATQVGLLVLAPGLATGQVWLQRAGAVVLVAGLLCSGVALRATLRTRRRRRLEAGLQAFVAGGICFALAATWGFAVAFAPADWIALSASTWLYGLLIIVGGLSLTVLGMLCKIIPFLVWMRAYGPWVGKRPVPTATTLAWRGGERCWLVGHVAALVLLAAGWFSTSPLLLTLGTASLALAIGLLITSFVRIARHLVAPSLPAATPAVQPIPL